ncbi:MAG: hypothetical protein R3C61_15985 [Bacteroidia bacterium]
MNDLQKTSDNCRQFCSQYQFLRFLPSLKNIAGVIIQGLFYTFVILSPLPAIAQENDILPSARYTIEYDIAASANTYIWLRDQSAGKKAGKIKVNLPNDYEIYDTPRFITDYVVEIRVNTKSSYSEPTLYYYLYVPTAEGGFFLKDDDGRYIFRDAYPYGKNCLIVAGPLVFSATGERMGLFHKKFTNTISFITKNPNGEITEFYNFKTCEKNKISLSGSGFQSMFFEFGSKLFIVKGDSLEIFDLNLGSFISRYPSVPKVVLTQLAMTKSYGSHYRDPVNKTKLFPVRINDSQWTYINENAESVFPPFQADLALPFVFPKNQAPIMHQGKWGLIDKTGVLTAPFQFDKVNFGEFYSQTIFSKKDSLFTINQEGQLMPFVQVKNENAMQSVCLVYYFKGPQSAYLLVTLSYDATKPLDHQEMADWVLNRIQSEISSLWQRNYYRVNDYWNNIYQADELILQGCETCKRQFEQLSSQVIMIEKVFK